LIPGEGGPEDEEGVKAHIQDLFLKSVENEKQVYSFFTCGLDTKNIDRVNMDYMHSFSYII